MKSRRDRANGLLVDLPELPPLSIRAEFRADSVDSEARTADIVWTTGARVLRGFFERFYEELGLDPKHVRAWSG